MSECDTLHLDMPASLRYLNVVSASIAAFLERCGTPVDHTTIYNTQLAVQEACTNIVRHAYAENAAGRISVCLTLLRMPPRLRVELSDTGRPFDPCAVELPDLDEVQIGGYGLFLIQSLMDEVSYDFQPGCNRLCMVKRLTSDE